MHKIIIGLALAAVAGLGFFEAHQISQGQNQIRTLQEQQTFLLRQVRQLQEAHQETARQVAALPAPSAGTPTNAAARAAALAAAAAASRRMESQTIPSQLLESEMDRAFANGTWGGREAALKRLERDIATNDLPRALAYLAQRPGGDGLETPLFDALASRWGGSDPNAAVAWANSLQDTNAQQRAVAQTLLGWSKEHRDDALNYAAAMAPGDLQNAAIKKVVGDWTFWDAPGASQWLAQNPQFAEQTLGGLIFWGQGQCPAAIADLLDQQYALGHPNWMQESGEQVGAIWLSRDPAAARAWIKQAPLSDEVKQRLLKEGH